MEFGKGLLVVPLESMEAVKWAVPSLSAGSSRAPLSSRPKMLDRLRAGIIEGQRGDAVGQHEAVDVLRPRKVLNDSGLFPILFPVILWPVNADNAVLRIQPALRQSEDLFRADLLDALDVGFKPGVVGEH